MHSFQDEGFLEEGKAFDNQVTNPFSNELLLEITVTDVISRSGAQTLV